LHRFTARELEREAAALPRPGSEELDADQDLGAEPERLRVDAGGKLGAADPVGEAGVVLDPRTRSRLPARCECLDDKRSHGKRASSSARSAESRRASGSSSTSTQRKATPFRERNCRVSAAPGVAARPSR
jgi:hypothetical protein